MLWTLRLLVPAWLAGPVAVSALSPKAADSLSPLRDLAAGFEASWTELDVSGKTGLVLTLDDSDAGNIDEGEGKSRNLYIPIVRGQLGDSLRQLGWALFYAEQNNFSTVDVTHQAYTKHFQGFVNMPEHPKRKDKWGKLHVIDVQRKPAGYIPSSKCKVGTTKFDPNDSRPAFHCGGLEPQEWARILKLYVKPNLVSDVLVDNKASSGELVIHMRSGDAMTSTDPLAKMEVELPPCALYDLLIEEGNDGDSFKKVRVITQNDNLNPCVGEVQRRHPATQVTVQRGSLNEDAAAIMNAKDLVLSPSFLSFFMALMNEKASRVYYADSQTIADHFPEGVMPCGALGDAQVYVLNVPNLADSRPTLSQRQSWMTDYKKSSITVKSSC